MTMRTPEPTAGMWLKVGQHPGQMSSPLQDLHRLTHSHLHAGSFQFSCVSLNPETNPGGIHETQRKQCTLITENTRAWVKTHDQPAVTPEL